MPRTSRQAMQNKPSKHFLFAAGACLLLFAAQSRAQDLSTRVVDLAEIKVTPRPEGPLLWKAQRGDATLWVLVLPNALPQDISLNLDAVDQAVGEAGTLLHSPGITTPLDVNIFKLFGVYRKVKASRENPDGKRLAEVLNPEDYRRWSMLAARYLDDREKVEKLRPYFASQRLYGAATVRNGMTGNSTVWRHVETIAKKNKATTQFPSFKISLDNSSQSIKSFSKTAMNDEDCFRASLREIEQFPRDELTQAQAWAAGDVVGMARIATSSARKIECENISISLGEGQQLSGSALAEGKRQAWLSSVDQATKAAGAVAFGVLPIDLALGDDGYIASLEQSGYEVSIE